VKTYANEIIVPAIRQALENLPSADHHTVEVDETGEKIWISFPSVTEAHDEYLKSQVLIELGGRNVIDPNERHWISPDVAELTPEVDYPASEVVVLSPERTFWEKATLIHVECHRGQLKASAERLSRHWYDLVMLAQHVSGQAAIHNRELFEEVVRHKQVFFNASHANYEACLEGQLRLLPEAGILGALQADYEEMIRAGMMYQQPPSFDAIVDSIRRLEKEINVW